MDVSFGSRARVGALRDLVAEATTGKVAEHSSNPLLYSIEESLSVGLTKHAEERNLAKFLTTYIAKNGPLTTLERPAHVAPADWNGFLVQKAATLLKAGRTPADVSELTVNASGSVDGQPIDARTLFAQRYKAQGPANGTTIVIAPGFLETGRSYAEQALALSAKGYEVVVFDQQWAGMSTGNAGGIDRGFGIARDVAAVTAKAAEGGNEIIILGTSMGGGPGAYGAIHLNEENRIALNGPQMPKGVKAILQAPYFGTQAGIINDALSVTGYVPGVRDIPLPAVGVPILSSDPVTLHKLAAHAVIEGITGRAQGFHAAAADIDQLRDELPDHAPKNPIYVIQGDHDALASYRATEDFVYRMGPNITLDTLETTNHVFEETPGQQDVIFKALAWLEAQR